MRVSMSTYFRWAAIADRLQMFFSAYASQQSAVLMQCQVVAIECIVFSIRKGFGKGVVTSRCSEAELKKSHSS